jgi:hypothetical protein
MVEQANIDQVEGLSQPAGECLVRSTGFGHSRWVIMRCNQGGGVEFQRPFDYLAWIYARTVYGASEEFFKLNDPVPVVEEQRAEHFMLIAFEPGLQEAAGVFGPSEHFAFPDAPGKVTVTEFKRGLEQYELRRPDAFYMSKIAFAGIQQWANSTELGEHGSGYVECCLPRVTSANKYGEQLCV